MQVKLRQLDPRQVRRPWRSMEPLHANVREIINTPAKHRQPLLSIADFQLPAEHGYAYKSRQNMVRVYGSRPEIAGLTFYTVRHAGDRLESLICFYDPDAIVEGEYEKFRARIDAKKAAKQANRKEPKERLCSSP